MDNMELYNKVRKVPENAKTPILGGRLRGKTDINPMWRIQALTEHYGPCGIGWKPIIKDRWVEQGANGEIAAFVEIDLYVKHSEGWSDAIPGIGGNMFVEKESSGLHVNDECYKMAYTDAISVACKALGFGADTYWEEGSKYTKTDDKPQEDKYKCIACGSPFEEFTYQGKKYSAISAYNYAMEKRGGMCASCAKKAGKP